MLRAGAIWFDLLVGPSLGRLCSMRRILLALLVLCFTGCDRATICPSPDVQQGSGRYQLAVEKEKDAYDPSIIHVVLLMLDTHAGQLYSARKSNAAFTSLMPLTNSNEPFPEPQLDIWEHALRIENEETTASMVSDWYRKLPNALESWKEMNRSSPPVGSK